MNGVVVFMLGGVSQVWRWSYALWYGGKEVSLKNEKKKKTRKQLRILNDLRIMIPIDYNDVGDEYWGRIVLVTRFRFRWRFLVTKIPRCQQDLSSATNTRKLSSILSHQHCCIRLNWQWKILMTGEANNYKSLVDQIQALDPNFGNDPNLKKSLLAYN